MWPLTPGSSLSLPGELLASGSSQCEGGMEPSHQNRCRGRGSYGVGVMSRGGSLEKVSQASGAHSGVLPPAAL